MKQFFKQLDFIGIDVPLPHLDLGKGASGYIAAIKLELCGKLLLRHVPAFPQPSDILSETLFVFCVHATALECTYTSADVDFIVAVCYTIFALIQVQN